MENLNEENNINDKKEEKEKIEEKGESNNDKNPSKTNKKSKKKKKNPKEPKKTQVTEEDIAKFRELDNTINESFISYYKNLLNFSEEEFSEFLKISVKELPIIFRINKIYTFSESLEEEITELILKENEHYKKA